MALVTPLGDTTWHTPSHLQDTFLLSNSNYLYESPIVSDIKTIKRSLTNRKDDDELETTLWRREG